MRLGNLALPVLAAFALSACGNNDQKDGTSALPGDENMVEVIGAADDLSMVGEAMQDAALNTVFEGVGPYTLLAPIDSAFESFVSESENMDDEAKRIVLANMLTGNVLPGFLTLDDIKTAIKANGADGVTMRSMDDIAITFRMVGDDIEVTSNQGGQAKLLDSQLLANNGAILKIDALLKPETTDPN